MSQEKKCLECHEPIKGRSDKKFCSDLCRNSHNNKIKSDSNNFVRNVNNALKKNRRLLIAFAPEGKASIHKNKMLEKGFNFTYYTHTYTTRKGTVYYFCYEYGYLPLENDFYMIVHRKDYVE